MVDEWRRLERRRYQGRSSRPVRMSTFWRATWRDSELLRWRLPWARSPIASSVPPGCGLCCLTGMQMRISLLHQETGVGGEMTKKILTLCKLIDWGSWLWFSAPFSSFFTVMSLQKSKLTMKTSLSFELVSELLSVEKSWCERGKRSTSVNPSTKVSCLACRSASTRCNALPQRFPAHKHISHRATLQQKLKNSWMLKTHSELKVSYSNQRP